MANRKVLAFDIGGTKISSAVIDMGTGNAYDILDYKKHKTPDNRADIVAKILEITDVYKKSYKLKSIGLAVAGQIDADKNAVVCSPNIPVLDRFPLGRVISRDTGLYASIQNDVQAFAKGEDRFGKAAGCKDALFIAVGTGIGGAVKVNGKFYHGRNGIAGEFGHMVVEKDGVLCACGRKGCWERYAGGQGMERIYESAYGSKKSAKDILYDGANGNAEDEKIMVIVESYFAAGLANLVNVFDPEMIIVGGSMLKEKKFLQPSILLARTEILPSARKVKIATSSLGDKAFLLGAALG